jgi:hypothetical protein
MMKKSKLHRLLKLEEQARALRKELGISALGEILFEGSESVWPEREVVVEANGRGGATLMVVEGNYPMDYLTIRQQQFSTEDDACEAAEELTR